MGWERKRVSVCERACVCMFVPCSPPSLPPPYTTHTLLHQARKKEEGREREEGGRARESKEDGEGCWEDKAGQGGRRADVGGCQPRGGMISGGNEETGKIAKEGGEWGRFGGREGG